MSLCGNFSKRVRGGAFSIRWTTAVSVLGLGLGAILWSADRGLCVEPIELSAKAEPKTVYVGDEIAFEITVRHLPNVQVFLPGAEADLRPFEVKRYRPLTRREEDSFIIEGGSYHLTVFELGTYVIPSVTVSYLNYAQTGLPAPSLREEQVQGGPSSAKRFVKTQPIPIVVRSLLQEKQEVQKKEEPLLKSPPSGSGKMARLWKSTMSLLAAVGFLCLAVYGIFYFWPKAHAYRPPVPAHRIAEKGLKELQHQSRALPPQEMYLQLSQLLRSYLAGRFETLGLHLSTGELLAKAKEEKALAPFLTQLSNFFEEVDGVKFAGHPPSAERGNSLFQVVQHLVTKTTPKEEKGA